MDHLSDKPERRIVALPRSIPDTWAIFEGTTFGYSEESDAPQTQDTVFGPATDDVGSHSLVLLCLQVDAEDGRCNQEPEVTAARQAECEEEYGLTDHCVPFSDPVQVAIDPEIPGWTAYFLFKDADEEIKKFFSEQTLTTDWDSLAWLDREIFL